MIGSKFVVIAAVSAQGASLTEQKLCQDRDTKDEKWAGEVLVLGLRLFVKLAAGRGCAINYFEN